MQKGAASKAAPFDILLVIARYRGCGTMRR
jgi:hypothetical protein